MMSWHGYLGIEDLGLNSTQRATLVSELKALGPASNPSPACLNHWRTRLDGEAAIFEALFNKDNLTISKFKARLANIFGMAVASIDHTSNIVSFANGSTVVVVFSRSGTNYLRLALFGGVGSSWTESGDECRGYLATHSAEWESEL